MSAEASSRVSGLAAIQGQIDNLLSGSPESLNQLAEIVSMVQSADDDLTALITQLSSDVAQIRSELDILTNQA